MERVRQSYDARRNGPLKDCPDTDSLTVAALSARQVDAAFGFHTECDGRGRSLRVASGDGHRETVRPLQDGFLHRIITGLVHEDLILA
jgi:hypothetical protein